MGHGGDLGLRKFTLYRLLRLVRITRIVRLLRFKFFVELAVMVKGVLGGLRTLCWAFVLLGVLVYLLGIAMRQVTRAYNDGMCNERGGTCSKFDEHLCKYIDELFGTVFRSMFTVFRCFTDGCSFPDGTPLPFYLWHTHGAILICGYMVSFLFVVFGVFNLIAAVFVENTLANAKYADDKRHQLKHSEDVKRAQALQNLVLRICTASDNSEPRRKHSFGARGFYNLFRKPPEHGVHACQQEKRMKCSISRDVFDSVMQDRDVQGLMDSLEIPAHSGDKLFDILDADGSGELGVSELVEGMMRLRGRVDKGDIVAAALMLRSVQRDLRSVEARGVEQQQSIASMRVELTSLRERLSPQPAALACAFPLSV